MEQHWLSPTEFDNLPRDANGNLVNFMDVMYYIKHSYVNKLSPEDQEKYEYFNTIPGSYTLELAEQQDWV